MRLSRWLPALIVVAVLGVAGWQVFERYWYYLPGIMASLTDPVGPNRPVTWQPGPQVPASGPRPPNVIVILADDLGWNDLTFNGGGVAGGAVPTPRIDSIGADGVTFMQAYAGNATCAPSRAAIMTGRYATRFGFEYTPAPKAFSKVISTFKSATGMPSHYYSEREKDIPDSIDDLTVPTSEVMIGQMMKSKGYQTLALGKWHLGGTATTRPEARGFDEALAFYDGASMFLPERHPNVVNSKQDFDPIDKFLWPNLRFGVRFNASKQFEPDAYLTDYLGREAVKAIEANRNRPFFMYLAFNAPHTPLQALKSDYDALADDQGPSPARLWRHDPRARSQCRACPRCAESARARREYARDIHKRQWRRQLRRPAGSQQAVPGLEGDVLRGRHPRAVLHEMAWRDCRSPCGTSSRSAMSISSAPRPQPQRQTLPTDRVMDGVDLAAFVADPAKGAPHKSLFWRDGDYKVLLAGDWKLQTSERPRKIWLHNLRDDPTEQRNLADAMPDKVRELQQELAAIDAQQAKPLWPTLLEAPVLIDRPLGTPPAKDDEFIYWAN